MSSPDGRDDTCARLAFVSARANTRPRYYFVGRRAGPLVAPRARAGRAHLHARANVTPASRPLVAGSQRNPAGPGAKLDSAGRLVHFGRLIFHLADGAGRESFKSFGARLTTIGAGRRPPGAQRKR